jgi:hypothetical protein
MDRGSKTSSHLAVQKLAAEPRAVKHLLYAEHYIDPERIRPEDSDFTADTRYFFNITTELPQSILLDRFTVSCDMEKLYERIHQHASSVRICPWDNLRGGCYSLFGPRLDTSPRPADQLQLQPRPARHCDDGVYSEGVWCWKHLLEIDPTTDIELFAKLGPAEYRKQHQLPEKLNNLSLQESPKERLKAKKNGSMQKKRSPAKAKAFQISPEEPPRSLFRPTFKDSIEDSIQSILEHGQYWRGSFSVKAELGRIILTNVHESGIAFNNKNTPSKGWTQKELTRKLDNECGQGQGIHFTRILSTAGCDIRKLIDAKVSSTRLWQQHPCEMSTTYSFYCSLPQGDGNQDWFIIDVKESPGQRFESSVRRDENRTGNSPQKITYVHAIWRNWDMRIVPYHVDEDSVPETYRRAASLLCESVDTRQVLLSTSSRGAPSHADICSSHDHLGQMQLRFLNPVTIYCVRALTKWRYESIDGKSALDITEVVELENGGRCKDSKKFIARSRNEEEVKARAAKGEPSRWYEASIMSLEMENIFAQQNAHLGLGEVASWTAKELRERGLYETLYRPALEILRLMDRVGGADNNQLREKYYRKEVKHNDEEKEVVGLQRKKK